MITISESVKITVFKYIRLVIAEKLRIKMDYSESDLDFSDSLFSGKYGAFVTLHIHGNLRGCIGYIQGIKTFRETIYDLAVAAAFRDPRFSALSADEFDQIDIEVSVLSPVETVQNFNDITPGRDGLIISKGFSSGLLLPQVAAERNWNRETFLEHTCMKAGLAPGSWKDDGVKIEKFTAYVFSENEDS
ncbi:MAG: AmmeMemoRadiSam system protein A [Spirochaetes bacterium]|nr:AmmeMemoRadiSam system protein A [Spirochaetota bacterium]